jgi:hypothetical protein
MSTLGRSDAQTEGRSGRPNRRQRNCSSSCGQATPAGLGCAGPPVGDGIGVLMDGAMQQAPQWGRQDGVSVQASGMPGLFAPARGPAAARESRPGS